MKRPLAILNGSQLPAEQLHVPVTDAGFVLGVTVAEQIRTFRGVLFRLEDHIARLRRSMEIIDVSLPLTDAQLYEMATELVAANWQDLPAEEDLGLSIFVTPGGYGTLAPDDRQPRYAMHTYPLPFEQWSDRYQSGQRLTVTEIRQVPTQCWPSALKCRSRMHYYLADREARQKDPQSRALLLDIDGNVTEASTASLVAYFEGEGVVSPPPERILPGISVATLEALAVRCGIPVTYRDLSVPELLEADEAILSSTSMCMLPVSAIDGQAIGSNTPFTPGPVYERLMEAWDAEVGLDIRAQARAAASLRRG